MSRHFVELGNDLRLYFQVGSRTGTYIEENPNFLYEFNSLNAGFSDEIEIGIERAKELSFKVNINHFSGTKGDLFKGYDTILKALYDDLPRYNHFFISKDTGSGHGFGSGEILFEGVQELRAEEDLVLKGAEAGIIEITATCHVKRFMEWLKMNYMLGSHSYGVTPTNGTSGNPSYTRELRDLCYKLNSDYYVVRSSRFLSGWVGDSTAYRGAVLYRTEDYINFLLNSSYGSYSGATQTPFARWDSVVRGSIGSTINTLHTPLSHYTLYEQHDTGKEYTTETSNVLTAGTNELNPETEVYIPMGEVAGNSSFPIDVCATGYHGERDLEGNLWDYFKSLCEGFGTKAVIKYDTNPTIEFHPMRDFMSSSSTYASKSYKSINTITDWIDLKFTYHAGYVSQVEIQADEVYLQTGESKDTTLTNYILSIQNASINSKSFDTRMLFNNIPSDLINDSWSGSPFDVILTSYENSQYKGKEEVIPPNKVNKLFSKTTRTLSATEDNRAVQYLMVHPDCKFEISNGVEVTASQDITVLDLRRGDTVFDQNLEFNNVRENAGMLRAYADAIMETLGQETRYLIEMTLDSSQVEINQLGEVFEISGGIDQIIEGGASWLSGELTNRLILVDIEMEKSKESTNPVYKCLFTGS
tara:strand:+ start:1461 stop:3389 length:1929 start_codon:yes stop_codon:yes gene_type:complete